LERVHGVDMEFFREELHSIVHAAATIGATQLRKDGFDYILHQGYLVTVLPSPKKRPVKRPPRCMVEAEDETAGW
jgi:hypothetical protein